MLCLLLTKLLKRRYLNKKVSPVFDRTISAIRLTSAEHKMVPIDDEVRQELNELIAMAVFHNGLKMPAVGAHVPRPPNSWILYRQHHHRAIKEKNPKATNCELCKFCVFGHSVHANDSPSSNHRENVAQ